MSRGLPDAFVAALKARTARPALFYEGEFADGTLRLWSGLGDITWGGKTWSGGGELLGMGSVEEMLDVVASGLPIQLSGVPLDTVATALGQARQNAPGRIYLGMMNEPQRNFARGASSVDDASAWPVSGTVAGITFTKLATWQEGGRPAVRYRFAGTATGSTNGLCYTPALGRVASVRGRRWTGSATVRRSGGSLTGVTGLRLQLREDIAPSTFVAAATSANATSDADTPLKATRIVEGTSSNQIALQINLALTQGVAVDVTYDILGLQLEPGGEVTAFQGRDLSDWTEMVSDPVLFFAGRLDAARLEDDPVAGTCTVLLTYESRLADLTTARNLRWTHESQQLIYPGDMAFEYVSSIQDKEFTWGS